MAAPKGNKYALGNNGGRPPVYDNPELLSERIEAYFNGGANKRTVIIGKGENKHEVEIPLLTITGLCYYLGFESRQSFYAYEEKEEFSYIIKKARLRIEMNYEEMLQLDVSPASPIFALKNMSWVDKVDSDIKHNISEDMISLLRPFKERKPDGTKPN